MYGLLTLDEVKTLIGGAHSEYEILVVICISKSIDRMRTKRNVSSFIIRSVHCACDRSRIEPLPHHHGCIK